MIQHQINELRSLKAFHQECGMLEKAYAESGLRKYCKSDLKFPKMHDLTHHPTCILLFEDPMTYSTQVGERLNGTEIRETYSLGNKRDNEKFMTAKSDQFLAAEIIKHHSKSAEMEQNEYDEETSRRKDHEEGEMWISKGCTQAVADIKSAQRPEMIYFEEALAAYCHEEKLPVPQKVSVSNSIFLIEQGVKERIISDPSFHGKERISFAEITGSSDDGKKEIWVGKIHLIFKYAKKELAFVQYLDPRMGNDCLEVRRLVMTQNFRIVSIECLRRECPVVPAPRDGDLAYHVNEWLLSYRERY